MQQPDFNNTEIAFAYKTNPELARDYGIFRLINQGWLVSFGTRTAARLLELGIKAPVALGMKPTVYAVFCGGNSLEDARKKIDRLFQFGVQCILDYCVEGKETEEEFKRTTEAIRRAILFARDYAAVDIVSSKFTGLIPFAILEKLHAAIPLDEVETGIYQRAKERIYAIAQLAYENGVSLFVDAEESWIQQPLDDLTFELMLKYNKEKPIIYNTMQFYRTDRLQALEEAAARAKEAGVIYAVKLVRGAYMEKESARAKTMHYTDPIQPTKTATDRDYDEALKFSIDHIGHVAICVATHNEASTLLATQLMQEKQLPNDHPHIHFSQLLGMSDHITFNLAEAGYNASKYMPYGPVSDVIPYLIRRAQENTSVAGQMGRELKLLRKEVRRRKLWVI